MAKRANSAPTKKVTISTTPQVVAVLEWLVSRGAHGKNRAEAAERIVSEHVRQFLTDERFDPKTDKEAKR